MLTKTLIYIGASFDDSFLFSNVIKSKYTKYILYDILPTLSYYKSKEYGYENVKNEKLFLKTLKLRFGHYVRNKNRLYFPKHNLIYHIYTDCNMVKHIPKGDILLKNFVPKYLKELFGNRKIYVNCDTIHEVKNIECEEVHFEEYYLDCYCYCEFVKNI